MQQVQALKKPRSQRRRTSPNGGASHNQKIRRQLRSRQQWRSGRERRNRHQSDRDHQAAFGQPENAAEKPVKTAEPHFLHHPAHDPPSQTKRRKDREKNEEKS